MSHSRINMLIRALYQGTIMPEENIELTQLLEDPDNETAAMATIEVLWSESKGDATFFTEEKSRQILTSILAAKQAPVVSMAANRKKRIWWAAAVAIFLVGMATLLYDLIQRQDAKKELAGKEQLAKQDIPPGGDKAILTLDDGSRIILDSAGNGNLASQGNSKVIKLNGQILYKKAGQSGEVVYNTISTPRGGQYQLILADGTSVWLNAASSLHFPASFSGKERKVELTGEAYFEVAKNADMPFTVSVNNMQVRVLGTHFNINAYNDEQSVKTTLLEGVVKVSKGTNTLLLTPGQQARVSGDEPIRLIRNVDIDEVVAWKNGLFRLSSADIPAVLRKIARWYDIEIVYEGKQPEGHISGTVPMSMPLSKVLNVLQLSGIDFRLEGKKLFIK